MPSGAKKRKAAKKKLGKKDHNNGSHSNSQGNEDPKTRDERDRDNDGLVVPREGNGAGSGVNIGNEQGSKEVNAHSDDVAREFKNGSNKSSSSSGSGSSSNSDDDEVVVEKEKSEVPELEASVETSGVSDVVNKAVDESIPMDESVKQVVSLPQASTVVSESVPVDNSSTSDLIDSDLNKNVYEGFQQHDEKSEIASGVDKMEEKVIEVADGAGLLPQSSGTKAVEGCCADDDCKVSETQKYAEEQPLLSSAPMPARRTSWMNCCGLLEVFSGGSSR